jgi:hypothetical protein
MKVYGSARTSLAPILLVLVFFFLFLLVFGQKADAAGRYKSMADNGMMSSGYGFK